VGERHPSTAVSMTNLAWTERLRNRLAESEALYRRALPVLDSAWSGTAQISSPLVDFGIVLNLRKGCADAEPVFRRAAGLAVRALPATNGDVIRAERFHGICLLKLGRFAAAESVLVAAHQGLLEGFGPTNQYVGASARDLAELYQRWGRPAEAARYRTVAPKP
jgi:tetratricopeptide (TPR) repeat protein